MKFELHITVPDGMDCDEIVPRALEEVAALVREPPVNIGDMGGIYHPDAAIRMGSWQFT